MPWSMVAIKEDVWRNFQKYMGFPESTKDLTTTQVQEVFELCTRFFEQRVEVPFIGWPSEEELAMEQLTK